MTLWGDTPSTLFLNVKPQLSLKPSRGVRERESGKGCVCLCAHLCVCTCVPAHVCVCARMRVSVWGVLCPLKLCLGKQTEPSAGIAWTSQLREG